MKPGHRPMPTILRKTLFLNVCCAWLIFLFQLKGAVASQKHDYLTEEEIEQLRETQEPPLRMNVWTGILNKRFEKARSATSSKTGAKEEGKEEDSNSKVASEKPTESKPSPSKPREGKKKEPPETLEEMLNDYLNCVDEVSTNIENSRSLPLDPKEYLKSLNKLDGILQKQNQWFRAMEIKSLNKVERETAEEIVQAQHELAADLENAMDQLMEEIKRIKDAKKVKEKKD